ncbi:hypothetical protein BKI52_07655 [marine bacterium AO1-C]|nr:hypothetical protein BKI52_07655 [marine bacterium AO1-C]
MNYQIKCPDCQSDKLTLHGFGYESSNINPLLCMNCGLVIRPEHAIVQQDGPDNLKRLIYMMHQFSKTKAYYLFEQLTYKGKREAKAYIANISFEDIKVSNS